MAIKLIVGLGNKGKKYSNTYHNAGKIAAAFILKKMSAKIKRAEVFCPEGFMNELGLPTALEARRRGVSPEEVLVLHDDSDLNIGNFKLDLGVSSAGHRGVLSLEKNFKTRNFWRLRLGVRDPKEKVRKKAGDFVLKNMRLSHRILLRRAIKEGVEEAIRKSLF